MSLGTTIQTNTLKGWFRNQTTLFSGMTGQMQVSLHSGDPVQTGTAEVGGSSYARQNVTFADPSAGAVAASAALNFTGMPAATGANSIAYVGIWCGGGTNLFIQGGALTGGAQAVTAGNTFTLSSLSSSLT
jgi:hypothetical protein